MSGCAKAAIIVGVVVAIGAVLVVAAIAIFFNRVADDVEAGLEESPCEFITDDLASEVVGVTVTAVSGDSFLGDILGMVRDTRLLEDAPACFISDEGSEVQVWVSVYDGSDAAEVFAAQADIADGQVVSSTSIEGGQITVESDAFRGDDVPDLGDEAFCTELGLTGSGGVLARLGDRVVYVSVLALGENEGAEVFTDELCDRAVPVARAVLG